MPKAERDKPKKDGKMKPFRENKSQAEANIVNTLEEADTKVKALS